MHTGNLQPCTDVVGSVCKCTLEAFVFQQLEPKNTQQHVSLSELLTSLIVQFHQLHVNRSEAIAHNRNMISEKKCYDKRSIRFGLSYDCNTIIES